MYLLCLVDEDVIDTVGEPTNRNGLLSSLRLRYSVDPDNNDYIANEEDRSTPLQTPMQVRWMSTRAATVTWTAFSVEDSERVERAYASGDISLEVLVCSLLFLRVILQLKFLRKYRCAMAASRYIRMLVPNLKTSALMTCGLCGEAPGSTETNVEACDLLTKT